MKQAVNWIVQSGAQGLMKGEIHGIFGRTKAGSSVMTTPKWFDIRGSLVRCHKVEGIFEIVGEAPDWTFSLGRIIRNIETGQELKVSWLNLDPVAPLEALGEQGA